MPTVDGRLYRYMNCGKCGKRFRPWNLRAKFCSYACSPHGTPHRKDQHWWKNPRNGYIYGRVWEDSKWRSVKHARWMMEQHLGRRLAPSEFVHHKNHVKDDDRLENFVLMTPTDHGRHHNQNRPRNRGYKMKLTDGQRKIIGLRAKKYRIWELGNRVRWAKSHAQEPT